MDKALALESSGPGSNPCEGEILFTEEAWKKWARFVIYKKVNKEKGGNHYQTDFSALLNSPLSNTWNDKIIVLLTLY